MTTKNKKSLLDSLDQILQLPIKQGLTTSQAQAGYPQAHGAPNHRKPFLQGQQAIGLLAIGKAIGTGKVAAGRQGQPQNPQGPLVLIQGSIRPQRRNHSDGNLID